MPVDPLNAGPAGSVVDALDQRPADALAALAVSSEEVLQVAGALEPGRAAVVKVVDQADDSAVALGEQGEDGNFVFEEPRPGLARNFEGQGGGTGPAVEGVVAVP